MSESTATIRTLRFHEYGEPLDVLRLERAAVPEPGPGRIRVAVHACGLNPADWALCRGLFPGTLPRGVGLDVSGTVTAVGAGVAGVTAGDQVLGSADYAGGPVAGAADSAVMDNWAPVPAGLSLVRAAALPLVTETAYRHVDQLGVSAGQTVLVHGGGTMVGFSAVQIALMRGARVIATAGDTYAERLRELGATVVRYGDGVADRVIAAAGGPVDLALDTAPPGGVLPALVKAAGGDPRRVLTCSDLASAAELGVRDSFHETNARPRWDVLGEFAQYAADGKYTVPVARTFALEDWRAAVAASTGGHAHGKLILLPAMDGAVG